MSTLKSYSLEEIKKNNGQEGNKLWIIINNRVYDVTGFKHPGGSEILLDDHGTDRKVDFNSIHSKAAKAQSLQYLIGAVQGKEDIIRSEEEKQKEEEARRSNPGSGPRQGGSTSTVNYLVYGIFFVVVVSMGYVLFNRK